MTQQTAVEWLIKNFMLNGLIRLTKDEHNLYKELTDLAKQMEKEQKKHWHSENPKKDGEYICRMDNGYIKMCHYVNGIWYDMWDTGIKGIVKEWMNIPYDNF